MGVPARVGRTKTMSQMHLINIHRTSTRHLTMTPSLSDTFIIFYVGCVTKIGCAAYRVCLLTVVGRSDRMSGVESAYAWRQYQRLHPLRGYILITTWLMLLAADGGSDAVNLYSRAAVSKWSSALSCHLGRTVWPGCCCCCCCCRVTVCPGVLLPLLVIVCVLAGCIVTYQFRQLPSPARLWDCFLSSFVHIRHAILDKTSCSLSTKPLVE